MPTKSVWKLGAVLSVAGLMAFSSPMAQAIETSSSGAIAPVSSQAFPSFTFTFDSDFDLAAFDVTIQFVPTLLSFNAAASTLSIGSDSAPISTVLNGLKAASFDGSDFDFNFSTSSGSFGTADTSGAFRFVGGYLLDSYLIPAGSSVTLTGVFNLTGLAAGESTNVRVFGNALDTSFQNPTFDVSASVAAVPEPETWMLLLGGLGLIASRVRRASKARTDSEAASA